MSIVLRDFLTFPFNGGRGIRTDQLAGQIDQSQLNPNTGFSEYLTQTVVMSADGTSLTFNTNPTTADLGEVAICFLFVPDNIPRLSDFITITVNGNQSGPLLAVQGGGFRVASKDLTPGSLLEVIYTQAAGSFFIITPLIPRPQDFKIITTVLLSDTLTQSAVDAITVESTTTSPRIALAPNPSNLRDYVPTGPPNFEIDRLDTWDFYGVPMDAPNITGFADGDSRQHATMFNADGDILDDTFTYDSVTYKWVRRGPSGLSGNADDDDWAERDSTGAYVIVAFEGIPLPNLLEV